MTYYYIYKITCTAGSFKDKFYFGQHTTTNLEDGYKGSGKKLQKYYKKYPNDYIKEIICFCNDSDELGKKEYEIIHPFLGNEMCLNLIEGGNNRLFSNELKEKLSKSHKGVKLSEYHRNRISESRIGMHHSEETKKKISESHKGKSRDTETKKKISESHKGKSISEETKNKLKKYYKLHPIHNKGKKRIYDEQTQKYKYV